MFSYLPIITFNMRNGVVNVAGFVLERIRELDVSQLVNLFEDYGRLCVQYLLN